MYAHTNSDDIGRDLMMRHFDIRYIYIYGISTAIIVAIPVHRTFTQTYTTHAKIDSNSQYAK